MKNWKTTLLGALAGVLMCVGGAMNNRATNPNAPAITFGNVAPAAVIALLGKVAADASGSQQ